MEEREREEDSERGERKRIREKKKTIDLFFLSISFSLPMSHTCSLFACPSGTKRSCLKIASTLAVTYRKTKKERTEKHPARIACAYAFIPKERERERDTDGERDI